MGKMLFITVHRPSESRHGFFISQCGDSVAEELEHRLALQFLIRPAKLSITHNSDPGHTPVGCPRILSGPATEQCGLAGPGWRFVEFTLPRSVQTLPRPGGFKDPSRNGRATFPFLWICLIFLDEPVAEAAGLQPTPRRVSPQTPPLGPPVFLYPVCQLVTYG